MQVGDMSNYNPPLDSESKVYFERKKISELFQSFTVGLVYHRPTKPIVFLQRCIEQAKSLGENNILWDSFMTTQDEPTLRRAGSLPPTPRDDTLTQSRSLTSVEATRNGVSLSKNREKSHEKGKRGQAKADKEKGADREPDTPHANISEDEEEKDADSKEDETDGSDKKMGNKIDEPIKKVLEGSMVDLPAMPTNIVRIFLSSTFSDFRAERNSLPKHAYPKIQEFCADKGLDFQVVDMRWGVTDDMVNDHQVSELCIREIETCKQLSCGPNFVTLLGNRYGYQAFPAKIASEEFHTILTIADADLPEGAACLREWYQEDTNAVPSTFLLLPIVSKFKHYADFSEENKEQHQKEKEEWDTVYQTLQQTLRQSAKKGNEEGKLSDEEYRKYFISVTEEEVQSGVLKAPEVNDKVLCYVRKLEGIERNLDNVQVKRFLDLQVQNDDKAIDEHAHQLRKALVEDKIPEKLQSDNKKNYELQWKGEALEATTDPDCENYLKKFCSDFINDMMELIERGVKRKEMKNEKIQSLYLEALHHAKLASGKCEIFCGREDVIGQVKEYLDSGVKENSPLVISGKSGYGKTSLLSHIAKQIPLWYENEAFVVLRLMGTSPNSSTIFDVLQSVISQICVVCGFGIPKKEAMNKMGEIRKCFVSTIEKACKKWQKKRLILILDSVDQLQESYGAHKMFWLPKLLPQNCWVILSMLSDNDYTCFEAVKTRLEKPSCFVSLQPMNKETGEEIMEQYLQKKGRKLTQEQSKLILNAFNKCSQPLFLKLILDNALTWHSFSPPDSIHVPTGPNEAIKFLYESLESKYGDIFVRKALGYLTCGKGGLTGIEIEDVLSCDDEVLNEVYKYHDPPLEGVIRIPSLLWARLENELKEYLTEKQVDGKRVMAWYHRQFWEEAEKRFVQQEDRETNLHSMLADLFKQNYGIKKTIILQQRKDKEIIDADRCVAPQPLTQKNVRKLNALPYHLLRAERMVELKSLCLYNFKFLLTKFESIGIVNVMRQYEDLGKELQLKDDTEFLMFQDFLELCFFAFSQDPCLLAYHAVNRIEKCITDETPHMIQLIEDAKEWLKNTDQIIILPVIPMPFPQINSPLKFEILVGFEGVLTKDESMIVCSWIDSKTNKFKIQCLNLISREISASLFFDKPTPVYLSPGDKNIICCSSSPALLLFEKETGDLVQKINFLQQKYDKVTIRTIAVANTGTKVAVGLKTGKPLDQPKDQRKNQFKIESLIFIFDTSKGELMKQTVFKCRKHIERLHFVNEDQSLLAISHDRFVLLNSDTLEEEATVGIRDIAGKTFQILHGLNIGMGAVGGKHKNRVKILMYNFETKTKELSKSIHINSECEDLEAFGVQANQDASYILAGTTTSKPPIDSSVCLWNRTDDTYTQVPLRPKGWKQPSCLRASSSWKSAYVGWRSGHVSLVDFEQKKELYSYPAHGHTVYMILPMDMEKYLLTLSQDHILKMWDTKRLVSKYANKREETADENDDEVVESGTLPLGENLPEEENGIISESSPKAEENDTEQSEMIDKGDGNSDVYQQQKPIPKFKEVLYKAGATAIGIKKNLLITLSPDWQGVTLWNVEDGTCLKDISEKLCTEYHNTYSVLKDSHLNTSTSVQVRHNTWLCFRKRRDLVYICSIQGFENPVINAHQLFEETFFTFVPGLARYKLENVAKTWDNKLFLVCDGKLEIRNITDLSIAMESVTIPKITDEIPNIDTSGGKKKLSYYKVGMTVDGNYFLIVNPAVAKKNVAESSKYVDLVNLKTMSCERSTLPGYTHWTIMDDSFYFLVKKKGESNFDILTPNLVKSNKGNRFEYKSVIHNGRFLSNNGKLGIQLARDYSILIWKIEPLAKIYTLEGHLHEVSTARFSGDTRFVVSSSYDKTVRLWSVKGGIQLAVFHFASSVDAVTITHDGHYVAALGSMSQHKKRAQIFEIKNSESLNSRKEETLPRHSGGTVHTEPAILEK